MDQEGMQRCRTCPAFDKLPGGGDAGLCRAAPPVPLAGPSPSSAGRRASCPSGPAPWSARSRW